MTSMASALIQWVMRTQVGWMAAGRDTAGVSASAWVASIDMARLLQVLK